MSEEHDYGPLQAYEVIWRSGHIERVDAHQVLWPIDLLGESPRRNPRVLMHGDFDGHWRLVLAADVDDILSIRLVGESQAVES